MSSIAAMSGIIGGLYTFAFISMFKVWRDQ